jgi:hypothetical protein
VSDMETERHAVALITAGLADDMDALEFLIDGMSDDQRAESIVALTYFVTQYMQFVARLSDADAEELWQGVALRLSDNSGA